MLRHKLSMMLCVHIFLFLLMIFATSIVFATNEVILNGEHVTITAPPEYEERLERQITGFDDEYEVLLNLFGTAPYNGEKIELLYDSTINTYTLYAGNPIRIGKGGWGEYHLYGIAHELSHDFTLDSLYYSVIFPVSSFIEGWAIFGLSYCSLEVAPKYLSDIITFDGWDYYNVEWYNDTLILPTHETFKQRHLYGALDRYVLSGAEIEETNANPNIVAAMLQKIADEYGWDLYTRFFQLLRETNMPPKFSLEDRCKLFVNLLNLAAEANLNPMFEAWGFPLNETTHAPVAILGVNNINPEINENITFDASASYVTDGQIERYFYDFGDGENSSWTPLSVVTHNYASEGEHTATLIVMDDFGFTSLNGELEYVEITVVPELSSLVLLSTFVVTTVVVIKIGKKRPKKSSNKCFKTK